MAQVVCGSLICGDAKVYHGTEREANGRDESACARRRVGKNKSGPKGEEGLEINLDGE